MKYENKVTVACVNFGGNWGNKAARLEKMKGQVRVAARQGANIIVFPETALTGYECDEEGTRLKKPCKLHAEGAELVPGPSTEEMASLAKELDVYIVFGMVERDKANPQQPPYNATALVAPEGVRGTYRKLHLAPPPRYRESICFTAGNSLPVWETRFGIIGILICYDFNFVPELARIMALKGARLIINTMGSPTMPGKRDFLVQQTGCRATENLLFTASANLVGPERTWSFHGNSTIAGPSNQRFANILAEAGDTEEIISATLNFDLIDYWVEILPWKAQRQAKLIAEEFIKIAQSSK